VAGAGQARWPGLSGPDEILTANGKQFTGPFGRGGEVLFDNVCRHNGITQPVDSSPGFGPRSRLDGLGRSSSTGSSRRPGPATRRPTALAGKGSARPRWSGSRPTLTWSISSSVGHGSKTVHSHLDRDRPGRAGRRRRAVNAGPSRCHRSSPVAPSRSSGSSPAAGTFVLGGHVVLAAEILS